MPHAKKVLPVLLAMLALAGLSACGSSGDDSSTTTATATTSESGGGAGGETTAADDSAEPSVPTITIKNGEPVGGVEELEYSAGEQIRFKVDSDIASEVHVHGYDLMKDVSAGGSVSFSFPAEIEGIFEVELEESAKQIAELRVNP
jgi:hypothetical protein